MSAVSKPRLGGDCAVCATARGASNEALNSSGVVRANKNLDDLTNHLFTASYLPATCSVCSYLVCETFPAACRKEARANLQVWEELKQGLFVLILQPIFL